MSNKINTIKMVREIREKNYEDIKNMSNNDIISFFKEKSKEFMNKAKSKIVAH